jgi:hypothetical protein
MLRHTTHLVLLLIASFTLLWGQERTPIDVPKFGKIPPEHQKLTVIPADPDADIAILFHVKDMEINENFVLENYYHSRVKILAETGMEKVDVKIPYYKDDKITALKAHTILPNGKTIKVKKSDIFVEKAGNYEFKVFTFPAVEVGAIVEYSYREFSEYITFLDPWMFQSDDYTFLSKLTVTIPPGFRYDTFFTNISPDDVKPIREQVLGTGNNRNAKFTWQLQDIPAMREEPYVSNINDYLAALYFQLVSFKNAFVDYTFIKSWNDLAKQVHEDYQPYLEQKKELDAFAASYTGAAEHSREKIKLLYEFVRDSIETSGSKSFLSQELLKPKEVFDNRQGTSAEKNLLLINLLSHLGLEAHPFLISTRSHGMFRSNWAQLTQFNRVLAHVMLGGRDIIMDTANEYVPFGMLPSYDIVNGGLLIQGEIGRIREVPQPKSANMIFTETTAELDENGALRCKTLRRYEDYSAIVKRAELEGEDFDEYWRDWLSDKVEEAQLDSFNVSNMHDAEMPLVVQLDFHVDNYCQMVGDMIYLPPLSLSRLESNPFKREERTFPVDFAYRLSSTENVTLTLPGEFEIVEAPPAINTQIDLLRFGCACKKDSNTVNYQRLFMLSRNMYPPNEYNRLRDAYEKIVSADQGQLVLKRVGGE